MPSARRLTCPFERSCSGTDRASLARTVTTKLLAYEVHVYLAPCPHYACDSSTSYSYFCHARDQVQPGDSPLSSSNCGPDPDSVLADRVTPQEHRRGLGAVAFWLSSAVPHLAGRTDVSLSFDHDVADVDSPGL